MFKEPKNANHYIYSVVLVWVFFFSLRKNNLYIHTERVCLPDISCCILNPVPNLSSRKQSGKSLQKDYPSTS